MLTYFGWLYLNWKIRLQNWWYKSNSEPTNVDTIIQKTDPKTSDVRYDYNKY